MELKRKAAEEEEGGGGEHVPRWAIIWLDMMNSLLALFIALFAFSEPARAKIISLVISLRETLGVLTGEPFPEKKQEALISTEGLGPIPGKPTGLLMSALEEIRKEIQTRGEVAGLLFRVFGTREGPVIRISTQLLFEPGSAELKPEGKKVLKILAKYLKLTQARIRIEGHTDDIPIRTPQFPSNWELSAARAAAVARVLEEYGVPREWMEVVGYADTKPIVPNTSPENRAMNRRVEIKIINPKIR